MRRGIDGAGWKSVVLVRGACKRRSKIHVGAVYRLHVRRTPLGRGRGAERQARLSRRVGWGAGWSRRTTRLVLDGKAGIGIAGRAAAVGHGVAQRAGRVLGDAAHFGLQMAGQEALGRGRGAEVDGGARRRGSRRGQGGRVMRRRGLGGSQMVRVRQRGGGSNLALLGSRGGERRPTTCGAHRAPR